MTVDDGLEGVLADAENRRDDDVIDLVWEHRRLRTALRIIAARRTPTFTHAGYTIRLDADSYARAVLDGRDEDLWDDPAG